MPDWTEILARHGGIVWKTVRRIVGNDDDARDCFQETFVAAWEYSQKHEVSNWPGLLKRLATVRALDHLRRQARKTAVPLLEQRSIERTRLPSTVAEENELFDRLRSTLATMPADQAATCCLRFLERLSYDEISEQLGVTVNHVGVLLHRAKSTLQTELAEFRPAVHSRAEAET
jgi:RNA polymerase sigma factor (sigma-70 family)